MVDWDDSNSESACCLKCSLLCWYYLKLALDISVLVIGSKDRCDDVFTDGNTDFGGMDPTTWMIIGGIFDLIFSCCGCCIECIANRPRDDYYDDDDWIPLGFQIYDYRLYDMVTSLGFVAQCNLCISSTFLIIWVIFGFGLASIMEGGDECTEVTLAWSIIQCLPFALPLILCVLYIIVGICCGCVFSCCTFCQGIFVIIGEAMKTNEDGDSKVKETAGDVTQQEKDDVEPTAGVEATGDVTQHEKDSVEPTAGVETTGDVTQHENGDVEITVAEETAGDVTQHENDDVGITEANPS